MAVAKSCLATKVAATHREVGLRRLGSSQHRSALLAILIAVARVLSEVEGSNRRATVVLACCNLGKADAAFICTFDSAQARGHTLHIANVLVNQAYVAHK